MIALATLYLAGCGPREKPVEPIPSESIEGVSGSFLLFRSNAIIEDRNRDGKSDDIYLWSMGTNLHSVAYDSNKVKWGTGIRDLNFEDLYMDSTMVSLADSVRKYQQRLENHIAQKLYLINHEKWLKMQGEHK